MQNNYILSLVYNSLISFEVTLPKTLSFLSFDNVYPVILLIKIIILIKKGVGWVGNQTRKRLKRLETKSH